MNKLFVGNLSWKTSEDQLKAFFESIGINVVSAKIVIDQMTKKSKGFGFVEIDTAEGVDLAIAKLNGQSLDGREIRISRAQERPERSAGDRPQRSGGDRGFGGGDRGFGGGNRSSDSFGSRPPYRGGNSR